MNYPELLNKIEALTDEEDLALRAIGMGSLLRLPLREGQFRVRALSRPIVAVLSTSQEDKHERDYTVLATAASLSSSLDYPLIITQAELSPDLTTADFLDEVDEDLVRSYTSLVAGKDVFQEPINLSYLEGYLGTLVINGTPTFPHEVIAAHTLIY